MVTVLIFSFLYFLSVDSNKFLLRSFVKSISSFRGLSTFFTPKNESSFYSYFLSPFSYYCSSVCISGDNSSLLTDSARLDWSSLISSPVLRSCLKSPSYSINSNNSSSSIWNISLKGSLSLCCFVLYFSESLTLFAAPSYAVSAELVCSFYSSVLRFEDAGLTPAASSVPSGATYLCYLWRLLLKF